MLIPSNKLNVEELDNPKLLNETEAGPFDTIGIYVLPNLITGLHGIPSPTIVKKAPLLEPDVGVINFTFGTNIIYWSKFEIPKSVLYVKTKAPP